MNIASLSHRLVRFALTLSAGLAAVLLGNPARAETLALSTTSLPAAVTGVTYAQKIAATGGTAPLTWAIASGTLPAGFALNSATGALAGTTTAAGTFSFQVKVTDAAAAKATRSYSLKVTAPVIPPLTITTTKLGNATVGTPYAQTLTATGGKPPYKWTVLGGGLADGMVLDSATGQISGTPTASGSWVYSYPFRPYIGVTDAGTGSAAAAFPFSILPPATPVVTQYTLTVVGGSGGGLYAAGATANVVANAAPVGQVFQNWTGATVANALATSTTLVMPAANTTVTAHYAATTPPPVITLYPLTVVHGSGSGSYAAGTTVTITAGAAPGGQIFEGWSGSAVTNSLAATTTVVMPAAATTVTATYVNVTPPVTSIPQPVTGHPRLWLTPADLPKLRGWATASNPVYQQGLLPLLNQAIADYNTQFFPGGVANPVNPDLGDTQGYQGLLTEQYALIFAFHSLIDPNPTARILHAQRARNLLMVAMNEAAKGALAGAPFRDPLFSVYNRANFTSEAWPLVVDWIYSATDASNQPILSAQDKATIRTVFLRWAGECLNASTTGGDHPSPVGTVNSVALLNNGSGDAYRMASNNYYLGHARLVTLMSLSFDPADDPAIDPATASAVLGNSLRSYITDATGAWLYQEFAMLGDPAAVRTAYGLAPTTSVGLASGGLPPEGMLYGHSYAFIFGQLLALKTAGFADPTISGPQVALANNPPVWDRFVHGMITSLVPAAQVFPSASYLGPVYQMASYGDILRLWITPDFVQPFALLALLDQQNGDPSRLAAERWFAVNAVEGGAANLLNRVAQPWSYGVQDALLAFTLLDPTVPAAADPRPNYPTAFFDAPQGRLVEHTDWSAGGTMVDFRSSWISINHQQADGNQFEFYRKGEWLTKGVANYDNNLVGLTTDYHNTLSLKNWCAAGTPANLGWWEGPFWANGSQWQLGGDAGDPAVMVSVQPGYTYTFGDTTNLYNKPSFWTPANAALDILHASRSLLWLKPDYLVIYDRATSHTAGLFKRFNLALTAPPVPNGNVLTTTTPKGQHLHISSLLPAGGTLTNFVIGNALNPMAELEPSTNRLVVEDPATPTDARFLHVLQGADAGVPADPTALVRSSAGTAFEGALVLDRVVMFKRDVAAAFAGVTYAVPSTTTAHYVTGLAPNTGYSIARSTAGGTDQITITVGGSTLTDVAGVLAF